MSMDRDKALDMALAQIDKQYGKGSIMRMGEKALDGHRVRSPTGALSLDLALGVGGLPRGRVVEIFGPESSGKSTLAMHVVAEAQRNGGICAYIDAEHAMDPVYAKAIGVDIDQLLISQPDTGEQALEIADMLVRSGALDVVVIDSVAALTPRAEIEGEMGDTHVGLQARLMSQALRKLTANLNKTNTICHLHQPAAGEDRRDVRLAGDHAGRPGAEVLLARSGSTSAASSRIKDGAEVVGNRTRVKVVKNKVRPAVPPGRVRHHVRQGHQPRGLAARHGGRPGHRQEVRVPGSPTRASSSARAGRTPRASSSENPEVMVEISDRVLIAAGLKPIGRDGRGRTSAAFSDGRRGAHRHSTDDAEVADSAMRRGGRRQDADPLCPARSRRTIRCRA